MSKKIVQAVGQEIASMYGGHLEKVIYRDSKYVFVIYEHRETFETTPMTEKEILDFEL